MQQTLKKLVIFIIALLLHTTMVGQSKGIDRFQNIDIKLKELAIDMPGLDEKIELSVSNLNIQDFIRAIANTNKINIHISPDLDMTVNNNFSNVSVSNILLFLCKEYDLDITFYNNILSISKWKPTIPEVKAPTKKEIKIKYNKSSETVNMDLKNDTLSAVAKEFTAQTGINIIFTPKIGTQLVSFYVDGMPLSSAIENLATTNGLTATLMEGGYYAFEPANTEGAENTSSNTVSNSIRKPHSKRGNSPRNNGFDYEITENGISLSAQNAKLEDIVNEISQETKKDYIIYTPLQGTISTSFANVSYDEFINKILAGSKYAATLDKGTYLIGERQREYIRETRVIQLQNRSVDTIAHFIPKEILRDVTVQEFPELNSLIVSGSRSTINEIENIVQSIDKVVPVILIEVIMISSKIYSDVSTGISLGEGNEPSKSSLSFNGGVRTTLSANVLNDIISGINGWGSSINLGKVNSSFYLSLSALEDQGVVKIHSTPKLATLNSHKAKLVIGETEYYKEVENTVIGTQNPQNIQSYTWKSIEANLSISIKPMYSGDDQITMEVTVSQSGFKKTAGTDAPPGSDNKSFSSIMRVKNEEMVLLGGLEEKSKSDVGSGFPVLSKIPVIKWIFSNRNRHKDNSQLNIFIRPTILF